MIFNLKMDFTRKAYLIAGGHKTDPPMQMIYSSVVSCKNICVAFLMATLHDVNLMAADVRNTYLNAKTQENMYIVLDQNLALLIEAKL